MATITGISSTTTIQTFKNGQLQSTTTVPNPSQHEQVIAKRVAAHLVTITNWVKAHPTGATLTAAQTLVLAKLVAGLVMLTTGANLTITGT